jgi:hypothetical protein
VALVVPLVVAADLPGGAVDPAGHGELLAPEDLERGPEGLVGGSGEMQLGGLRPGRGTSRAAGGDEGHQPAAVLAGAGDDVFGQDVHRR